MPTLGGSAATLFVGVLALVAAISGASAQEQRCEGTLCDLYYRNSPPPQPQQTSAQPAPPTPLTVPTGGFFGRIFGTGPTRPPAPGAAPAPAPFLNIQGGGILADKTDERCEGTLCDAYYHGSPPPPARAPAPAVAAAPSPDATASAAPDEDQDATPETGRKKGYGQPGVQFAKPACVAPPGDPWRCYR